MKGIHQKPRSLQNLSDDLKKILNILPNSIYWKDEEGRYVWLNDASIAHLKNRHLISDSIIGKTDAEIFSHSDAGEYFFNDQYVLEKGVGISREEKVTLPTGEELTQLSFKEPLYQGGGKEPCGIVGYTIDITSLKKTQRDLEAKKLQAESANRAKTEFIANMSHDLRTPLAGMIGLCDLLLKQEEDQQRDLYIQDIRGSALELMKISNEVLAASSMDISKNNPHIQQNYFQLEDLIQRVVETLKAAMREKQINFKLSISDQVPKILYGHPILFTGCC